MLAELGLSRPYMGTSEASYWSSYATYHAMGACKYKTSNFQQ